MVKFKKVNRFSKKLLAKMNPLIVLRRIDLSSKVKFINMNPVIRLNRIDLYQQATRKNVAVLVPRVRFCIRNSISNTRDITEHDSPQNNKQNVPICLPEIDSSSRSYGSTSTDAVTPSQGISYENDWFSKKYKPYMEKLRNLTYDEISNFVKNNKEQYEKLKDTKKPTKGNSANTDTKDLFKCNPFNSEQQLAMYLTLRELFNVPETHFKQCKSFFTVVLPEISCQLFAQTFNIKVGSAPRLIKKLYPDPISPF
ncbi:uncharacterized protein LOC135846821 [Planococcus citri]|uniref:uncharacterized protein LOC135846821 n=1 Tax=Planococcus citri TaxID=170843 RepID=UPI0031FA0AE9